MSAPAPAPAADTSNKPSRELGETLGLVFNVCGLLMGCLLAITGLLQLIWASGWGDAQKALLGLYMLAFGVFARRS